MTQRKPINPWFIFFLICVPIFIGSVDLTTIVVVLPQATLDLLGAKGLSKADQALWAVTAYLLAYTVSLALVGRLSDVLPRKRIFMACVAIFVAGSVWAAFATDLPLTLLKMLTIWPDRDVLPLISLVIGRIIQATGAGASVSVGMALVSDVFPPNHRAEAISLIGAIDSLGWVVGNLYAGVILQVLPSWRWIFLINAGIALLALVLVAWALRHTKSVRGTGHYDVRGAAVFAAALIALVVGIEELNTPGPLAYGLLASSVALVVLFIWLQLHTHDALFDMKFIRQREVSVALITNLIVGFGLILMVAGVPLIINLRSLFLRGEGLLTGALRAGVMLSALTLPLIVAVLVGESRYRRVGAAIPVAFGLTLALIGFLGASLWTYTVPSYLIALPLALVGTGLGLTIGPLSLVVVEAAQESARGLASSLVLMMRLLGMTFGTPLAASLTLKLANDWASTRVEGMGTFRDIARSMLIPPMATDALAQVMLTGVVACGIGLIVFYLPRARQTLVRGMELRAIFAGSTALVIIIAIVGLLGFADTVTTPTVVRNPIAQQLPPNVTFYAALNIQQVFLKNTQRPLDAVMNALNQFIASQASQSASAATPAAPTNSPPTPPADQPTTSPTDNIVKALFRAKNWNATGYKQFCADEKPADQWQDCFNSGLLSWIGPQAAFALLPRTHAEQDYVFAFQATNRNNAIQFATNLATALGEKEPVDAGPNIRILTINGGTPDERRLAITQAYVLIGTPQAVQYTLNHGEVSLADQPDYQTMTNQLPLSDFATLYMRSSNFETDLKPAFDSLFENSLIDSALKLVGQSSSFAFTRNSVAPTLIGMSLRVDEQQLMIDMVASVPFSLQKLNASPVPAALLDLVPGKSPMWAAMNVNIAGLVREINIADAIGRIAPSGPIGQFVSGGLGQTVQNLLTYAQGNIVITALPVSDQGTSNVAVIVPMVEKEDVSAASALDAVRQQLQFLGGISGAFSVQTQPASSSQAEIVTVRGKALETMLPSGFQYTLTSDHLLILATGDSLTSFLETFKDGKNPAADEIKLIMPGALDNFMYAYIDPSQNVNLTALFSGQVRRSGFYLNLILRAK
ncbi:MAG: MFS transporter [Chloroflexota bacterium]